jgi:PleD family two-component response regulator
MTTLGPTDPNLTPGPAAGETDAAVSPLLPAILVVDDNAAKRIAIRAMLAPLGVDVIEAD